MKIEKIYLLEDNEFNSLLNSWAEEAGVSIAIADNKSNDFSEVVDAIAIFHENHNFSKELEELNDDLIKNHCPSHKIDVNGTLAATLSNFTMWLERNKPKSLLMVGGTGVAKNENLVRFLSKLSLEKV